VIVELAPSVGAAPMAAAVHARTLDAGGFALDEEFGPVTMGGGFIAGMGAAPATHVVRGTVENEAAMADLGGQQGVVRVWMDTPIAPFMPCPITPCDCDPLTPKGTIADVATAIGVDQIWAGGQRGAGVIVGVVDGGITAQGRPVAAGQTPRRIPNVVDGWKPDWGTEALWGEHGNMCSTDVLGMAPDAHLWDLRIADAPDTPGLISNALGAFQWAINQQAATQVPVVLTNSWGIFAQSWDPSYATDPNHPFTRKVVDAVNAGIVVLFAAGNCGEGCPDSRCGTNGPGQSIWGANGHPQVITVGAVNKNGEWVGYSSEGPAALDPHKPDVCSVTHFTGYENSDNGTSAATPILAGAVALLKQAHPAATTDQVKQALMSTAQDIGPAGWDQYSGAGMVRVKAAYDSMRPVLHPSSVLVCAPSAVIACHPSIACPSQITICHQSRTVVCGPSTVLVCAPSAVIACHPSVACPSQITICNQSAACPSHTVVCVPSAVVVCAPSAPVACRPSLVTGCPTSPVACVQSSVTCPSLAGCPSIACGPGGGPGPGPEGVAEQWGAGAAAWYQGWT
jgi:hypothetical protein